MISFSYSLYSSKVYSVTKMLRPFFQLNIYYAYTTVELIPFLVRSRPSAECVKYLD